MPSLHIYAHFPVPVLDSRRKYHHVTLPIGHHNLVCIPNPFPEDWKEPKHATDWWVDQVTGHGMVLEAWIAAHTNQHPLVEIRGVTGYVSGANLAEIKF